METVSLPSLFEGKAKFYYNRNIFYIILPSFFIAPAIFYAQGTATVLVFLISGFELLIAFALWFSFFKLDYTLRVDANKVSMRAWGGGYHEWYHGSILGYSIVNKKGNKIVELGFHQANQLLQVEKPEAFIRALDSVKKK